MNVLMKQRREVHAYIRPLSAGSCSHSDSVLSGAIAGHIAVLKLKWCQS